MPLTGKGVRPPLAFFVMPLADISLSDWLDLGHAHPQRARMEVLLEVAQGVLDIHGYGVLHRDIKPDNVLRHNRRWRIMDFGMSRVEAEGHGAGGVTFAEGGTEGFMPQEQADGNDTKESDIYAFGRLAMKVFSEKEMDDLNLKGLVERCTSDFESGRPSSSELVNELNHLAAQFEK